MTASVGKRQQHVQGQPAHRGGGVELLGDRDKGHAMLIEELDQFCEVGQGAGQAIDLIDDDDVDLAGLHVLQELLQGRPVGIAAREAAVVVFGSQQGPTGVGLAADIGLRSIILGIERVEVLLQPLVGRDAGIDRAANRLCRSGLHADAAAASSHKPGERRGGRQAGTRDIRTLQAEALVHGRDPRVPPGALWPLRWKWMARRAVPEACCWSTFILGRFWRGR
jgi:hypothetical protein